MAKHIRIRREEFSEEVRSAYRVFLNTVGALADEFDLDDDVVKEELSYLYEPSEMWAVK